MKLVIPQISRFAVRSLMTTAISAKATGVPPVKRPKVILFTGTDCSLCDVVKSTLEEARKQIPYDLQYYNIRDDSSPNVHHWRRLYQYDIPVVHLDGREIARHRLDKEVLMSKLREASQI